MTKDTISKWSESISKSFERERELSEKLSPSKGRMRYIVDYARSISDSVQLMNNASEMAHQKIISFEKAQEILDVQKKNVLHHMEYLEGYMKDD